MLDCLAHRRRMHAPAAFRIAASLPISRSHLRAHYLAADHGPPLLAGRRPLAHLKAYHYGKWEYLTWAFGRPGGRNDFRMLPWLLFGDDYGDATLAALKSEEKRWLLFVLVVFLSYPILTPILNA
jgi:hypothetical protein